MPAIAPLLRLLLLLVVSSPPPPPPAMGAIVSDTCTSHNSTGPLEEGTATMTILQAGRQAGGHRLGRAGGGLVASALAAAGAVQPQQPHLQQRGAASWAAPHSSTTMMRGHPPPCGIARCSHPGAGLQLDFAAAGICVADLLFWAGDVNSGKGVRWDRHPCCHRHRANSASVAEIHRCPGCRAHGRQARQWASFAGAPELLAAARHLLGGFFRMPSAEPAATAVAAGSIACWKRKPACIQHELHSPRLPAELLSSKVMHVALLLSVSAARSELLLPAATDTSLFAAAFVSAQGQGGVGRAVRLVQQLACARAALNP